MIETFLPAMREQLANIRQCDLINIPTRDWESLIEEVQTLRAQRQDYRNEIAELATQVAEYESGDAVMKLREQIAYLESQLKASDLIVASLREQNTKHRERIAELESLLTTPAEDTPTRTADYIEDDGTVRTYLIVDITK